MLAQPATMKRKNLKGLQLPSAKPADPSAASLGGLTALPASVAHAQQQAATTSSQGTLADGLGALELGIEFKVDIKQEDLKMISELGFGNGGTVSKVMHIPTRTIMAKKVIKIEAKPQVRRSILRELQIMHDCNSPCIIGFYGAYINDNDIHVCMEYMDCGSLDTVLQKKGPLPLEVLGKITYSVVEGLIYLYDIHRIIHRDVKPSNVLVNSSGKIKLCDFGVSGELINSIANTFVGTSTYMSPERIQGGAYTVKGDVWSLGLMLVELATGKFPLGSQAMGVLDLLQLIVREPAPTLDSHVFPSLSVVVSRCLKKDPAERASLKELLNCEFVSEAKKKRVDMAKWAKSTLVFKRVGAAAAAAASKVPSRPDSAASEVKVRSPVAAAGQRRPVLKTAQSTNDMPVLPVKQEAVAAPSTPM
ncbi:kinase-like domain-containing protein [Protomyces lactucae-debilis]|uniref:mitogen-activated protein kinase kinase n=1 Tax=Protomyces lactucae-debilis TaxID=2754530 RepID=A0A1Y2FQW6_PROLT|nr:kinase-like domain-containing protein [Protomyces lactucae-debilis]ORY86368.1 kinase-like domain-containing protein [Protomyces lactucae-debilis]